MIDLYIDPYVLACPDPGGGVDEFESYISGLITWKELQDSDWAQVMLPADTPQALIDTGSYPLWDRLSRAINLLGIDYVEPHDIMTLVDALLQKLPLLEDSLTIPAALVEDLSIEPANHLEGRASQFVQLFEDMCILITLAHPPNHSQNSSYALISRSLDEDFVYLRVMGLLVDYESADPSFTVQLPQEFQGILPSCKTMFGLHMCLNPITVWEDASTNEDYERAIRIYLCQEKYKVGVKISDETLNCSFGPQFIPGAKDLGFGHEHTKIKTLLRAMSETILSENMGATHEIRMGKGGNSPQVLRGEDGAWRRDIDYEFHLHYWKTRNGYEFASVVVHSNMDIPE